jgi:hypothetical protein
MRVLLNSDAMEEMLRKTQTRTHCVAAARMASQYLGLRRSLLMPDHTTSSSLQEFVTHAA